MTDLTELWKKGELPSGWYYTKLWKGCNVIDYFIGNQFLRYDDSDIVEVIAPVPSCEEWKKAYECVISENEEITTLKELLKECREHLKYIVICPQNKKIVEKLNQALGEDK